VFDDLPPLLTVEEAAKALRIGRGTAYEQVNRWLATGGEEGIPVVTFGRCFRVPRDRLARLVEEAAPPAPRRRPAPVAKREHGRHSSARRTLPPPTSSTASATRPVPQASLFGPTNDATR
jgi:excisionase family DNA binding protein